MPAQDNDLFSREVVKAVAAALAEVSQAGATPVTLPDTASGLFEPPQFSQGQVAIPCHPLAKVMKTSPVKIAQTLADSVNKHFFIDAAEFSSFAGDRVGDLLYFMARVTFDPFPFDLMWS